VVNIIQQNAHSDTSVGGEQHLLSQGEAAVVPLPEVVLHVERGLSQRSKMESALQSIVRVSQQTDAGARARGGERNQWRLNSGSVIEMTEGFVGYLGRSSAGR
jgi:hypothetical protein